MTYFIEHISKLRRSVERTHWAELEHDYLDNLKATNCYNRAFTMTHAKWVH